MARRGSGDHRGWCGHLERARLRLGRSRRPRRAAGAGPGGVRHRRPRRQDRGVAGAGRGVRGRGGTVGGGLTVFPGAIDVHLHLGHGNDISRPRVLETRTGRPPRPPRAAITCFIPYLMATEPFEQIFDDVMRGDGGGRAHRFRLSLHASRPRRSSPASPRYVARLWRAELQDLHEQPRRRGQAAGPAGHRRRIPVAAVRGGGRAWRDGLPASGDDRARLGAARPRAWRPIRTGGRACQLERDPAALRRGRRGAARRAISRTQPARRSTSSTPPRRRRSRRRCASAGPGARVFWRPARTT